MHDLTRPFEQDSTLELIKFDTPEGKHVFWHSSAHVLGEALERIYGCHLCIGPPLDEKEGGFYYDSFMADKSVSTEDFPTIQSVLDKIIEEKQTYERISVPKEVALEMFKVQFLLFYSSYMFTNFI